VPKNQGPRRRSRADDRSFTRPLDAMELPVHQLFAGYGRPSSCWCDVRNWCDVCDDRSPRQPAPTRPTRRDLRKFLIKLLGRPALRRRHGCVIARSARGNRSKPLMRRQIDGGQPSRGRRERGFGARRPRSQASYTLAFWGANQGVGLAFVTQRGYGRRRWLVR
jgi:hypothetical protein